MTDHFRDRRVFLLGDAAHIHSPAGGQGMNTGIGDAINLAWKLSAVIDNKATDRLLDSYELERMPFARRLVATTDRAFTLATAEGRFADFVRTRIVPAVVPLLFGIPAVRKYLFRAVSQATVEYRHSPLSRGVAGGVTGGDRLPWPLLRSTISTACASRGGSFTSMGRRERIFQPGATSTISGCINMPGTTPMPPRVSPRMRFT